ncbi:MAG: hypothetical protein DSM106950_16650 [Stigonema ocellatum SAG 48.90 = DSM 106950]|nr:hypothetical protein [Stigonema ocellatum SAG 48.90 = DSM 106950]
MKSKIGTIITGTMLAFSNANVLLPAFASDSFSLNQLLLSAQESPQSQNLKNQISSTLRSSRTNSEQVKCVGTKLRGLDSSVLGPRLGPFDCRFPNNITLRINVKNFVTLPSGRPTPLENAKNFNSMPKPISLSYKITSWSWKKTP